MHSCVVTLLKKDSVELLPSAVVTKVAYYGFQEKCCLCAQSFSIYLMGFEFANAAFSFLSFLGNMFYLTFQTQQWFVCMPKLDI